MRIGNRTQAFERCHFSMTLIDLEWLSEIFSDTKHRAVSLRQLSFLSTFTITLSDVRLSADLANFWHKYSWVNRQRISALLEHNVARLVADAVENKSIVDATKSWLARTRSPCPRDGIWRGCKYRSRISDSSFYTQLLITYFMFF